MALTLRRLEVSLYTKIRMETGCWFCKHNLTKALVVYVYILPLAFVKFKTSFLLFAAWEKTEWLYKYRYIYCISFYFTLWKFIASFLLVSIPFYFFALCCKHLLMAIPTSLFIEASSFLQLITLLNVKCANLTTR